MHRHINLLLIVFIFKLNYFIIDDGFVYILSSYGAISSRLLMPFNAEALVDVFIFRILTVFFFTSNNIKWI